MKPHRTTGTVLVLLAPLLVLGCAVRLLPPVPASLAGEARISGMPNVRGWGDGYSPVVERSIMQAWEARRRAGRMPHEVAILALSGGGTDGAYGAGVLCGWTEAGNRPEFDIVTGISTGALIAPFAFLGPGQDQRLRAAYTNLSTQDILRPRWWLAALTSDAIAEAKPLEHLVQQAVDAEVLQAVAREHAKGRRLFVGTTDLDAQRPVIWDLGAIAASGRPEALDLFRKVMVASSSVPAVFPPQYIEVEIGARKYQEMHVDGGTMGQVFHVGQVLDSQRLFKLLKDYPPDAIRRLYVIRNGPLRPEAQAVEPRLLPIARRAVATLIKANAAADLYRIYTLSRLEGAEFNMTYVPDDYVPQSAEPFATVDMRRLFDRGFAAAQSGAAWSKAPPGLVGAATRPAGTEAEPR